MVDEESLAEARAEIEAAMTKLDEWERHLGDARSVTPEEAYPWFDGWLRRIGQLRGHLVLVKLSLR